MRVLFVAENIRDDHHLGMMGISSILKQKGHCVEAIDARPGMIIEKLKYEAPTILAYSVSTFSVKRYLRINRIIKQHASAFSVFGGLHPTAAPEMIEEDGVDAVCLGEGDYAMLELADNLSEGKPITGIKNWWVKKNGVVFKNSLRPLLSDLDSLPFPDRSLFPRKNFLNRKKIHIMTGRGCPHTCDYCFNSYYNQIYDGTWKNVRRRSVENVIEEIWQFRKRLPLEFIFFHDAIFSSPRKWLKKFSLEYKRRVDIPFFCNMHAGHVTDETLTYLKEAGCHIISMGIESSDEYIRNSILGKNITRKQIFDAARLIKSYNIKLRTSSIINIPYGSLENDIETLKFNIECNSDYAEAWFLEAFPATKIRTRINRDAKQALLYSSLPNSSQKTTLENLRHLFPFVVAFPFLFS